MATQTESLEMMNRVEEHLGGARGAAGQGDITSFEDSMVKAIREVGRFTNTQLAQSLGELEKKGLVKPYRDGDNTVRYSLTEKRP